MRNLPLIFCGIFITLALSWTGIVLTSHIQFGKLQPVTPEGQTAAEASPGADLYPLASSGIADQGRAIYISNGCMYCHSQQVRRKGFGSDYDRGWGDRQSVPRDYIRQERVMLGTMRTGPDLMTVGERIKDTGWHHLHLYDPNLATKGSIMPPFRFLYQIREMPNGVKSPDAINFPEGYLAPGLEAVPTDEAKALVDYMLSLKLDYDLPEIQRVQ